MRLTDLDAQLVQYLSQDKDRAGWRYVTTLDEAQGLWFQCPLCAVGKEAGEDEGRRHVKGAHYILCWFRNPRQLPPVPDSAQPGPGRWWIEGTGLHDLTFNFGTPERPRSIQLTGGCSWHGYITNGETTRA